ncbi:hypothetical protein BJG01_09870 [Vibrio splendidus]|nr:hypothetical protein BJG01_09870 [Vibrio splendidus]URM14687.1 AlpA family phage regulatory protein [Vibrio splendidus]
MSLPKLIAIKELTETIDVSRATIYRMMDTGEFPLSIKLSSNRVAWYEHEIMEWINTRPRTQGLNREAQNMLNKVFQ